ncbi:CubicO group peptidase (beta-lactamase class C family) [Murinocardiopsis flavida]|uniref:CubicO group peptidase (Beta-lactamase class C family) n=1 Tax=Murinocardiopsis flavida TaxID=645275 RepID=A0A2P8DQ03_9ACTN|nr:serine hydrolase domain-containing protein [Murinocardiopsis flavida]PSK99307.1 CubicO group peptidase (beta-lactamase class C family) [Murinocardiopsis flavida]
MANHHDPTRPSVMAAALVATALLTGCASSGPETIEAFVAEVVPDGSSGSLVAAVDDQIVYCRGWGSADRKTNTDATCDTVYDVMSMTKQFTAAAVLKLQMQGKLDVGDPIAAHLDDVPSDKSDLTLQHLLTHTSGLVDSLGDDDEPVSRTDLVDAALSSRLLSPPGAEYRYSNVGYSLLAAIVEHASGTGYEEYLAANVFAPAGMHRTGYVRPDWSDRNVAVEYDADGTPQGRPFEHSWAADGPYWNLLGNGGMLSTARDLALWHSALRGDRILDEDSKQQLFEPRVKEEPGGDTHYAYGWVVRDGAGGPELWHNGANGRSYGEVARSADGEVLVFWVVNQSRSENPGWDFEELGPELTEGVIERLRGTE